MNKESKQLARRLCDVGCELSTGGKHHKVFWNGKLVTVLGTAGDRRSSLNSIADARRAGVPI